eukprot:jgi/Mesvir1/26724/Mv20501-RA.1
MEPQTWESQVYVVDGTHISVCDVLRVGLGVQRVADVMEEQSKLFKNCIKHTRPCGRTDVLADAITMTCILRALSRISWAQRRIECARKVVETLRASHAIVSAVFEIPGSGRPDSGTYSDLLITPLPDGVVTSEDIEHVEGWPFHFIASERMFKRMMKRVNVPDQAQKEFVRQLKRLARIDDAGKIIGTCSPGWEFLQICYEATGIFLRMHSSKNSYSDIFDCVLEAFKTVLDPVHRVPETRIFDLEWAREVDDRSHLVVTGMTKDAFRAVQTNLRPDEPVRYAYTSVVRDMHSYVRNVFRAANDHSWGSNDMEEILASVEERWSAVATGFGYRQLCGRRRGRRDIEDVKRLEEGMRSARLYTRGNVDSQSDMDGELATESDMETSGIGMGVS